MSKLTRRALLVTGGLATLGFAPTAARTLGTELLIRKGKDWGLCNEEEDNQNAVRYLNAQQDYNVPDGYRQIYGQRQYTLVGETDHTDKRIDDFFYGAENIAALTENGIKHLCLEKDRSLQPVIDKLANGTMLPEDYATTQMPEPIVTDFDQYLFDQHKKFAAAVHSMASLGIQVHCIDTVQQEKTVISPEADRFYDAPREFHRDMCQSPEGMTEQAQTLFGLLHAFKLWAHRDEMALIHSQRANDRQRLQIAQDLCGNDPAIIFMGNSHFEKRPDSFRGLLGSDALHISIYGDNRYYELPKYNMAPDFVHLVEQETVYRMPEQQAQNHAIRVDQSPRKTL